MPRFAFFFPELAVAFALAALPCSVSGGAIDTLYRAGFMNGRALYWVPQSGLPFDTIGFGTATAGMESGGGDFIKSPDQAAAFFQPAGKTLLRVSNPCATAVAALFSKGYDLLAITQWRATPRQAVLVPRPGMIQQPMRHTILSDIIWTAVERADIEDLTTVNGDLRVRISFSGSGYSLYDGRGPVTNTQKELRGAEGLSVTVRESNYHEDLNVQRTVFGLYVLLPPDKKPSQAIADIEKEMDRLKLDLSYKIPELVVVQ